MHTSHGNDKEMTILPSQVHSEEKEGRKGGEKRGRGLHICSGSKSKQG